MTMMFKNLTFSHIITSVNTLMTSSRQESRHKPNPDMVSQRHTRQLKQASGILQLINFWVLNKFNATFHVMLQSWGTQRLFSQVQKWQKRYIGGWEQRITFIGLYCCPRPVPPGTPYCLWQSKHMHTVHNKKAHYAHCSTATDNLQPS